MDTNNQNIRTMVKSPVFAALGWFVMGSFLGFVVGHPPTVPMTCNAPMLRAHFLERQIAFETSALRSASSQSLRAAAPEEVSATSEQSSISSAIEVPAIVVPIVSSVSSIPEVVPAPVVSSSISSAESASSSAPASAKPSEAGSSVSESTSASSSSTSAVDTGFPAFDHAVYPVGRVPNWGAMKTPAEWNRSFGEMARDEFVRLPAYDLDTLTTPMKELLKDRDDPNNVRTITAKLFYSTRFFGSYDLDAGEFSGKHAGIDLKLPEGTPVGAIAGGRVSSVTREESGLGLHVIIEHRLGDDTFYSIYGHLSSVGVTEGRDVAPGVYIGAVGNTGRSTAPHLHLQVDRGIPGASHAVYNPSGTPTRTEATRHTVHPLLFISAHAR